MRHLSSMRSANPTVRSRFSFLGVVVLFTALISSSALPFISYADTGSISSRQGFSVAIDDAPKLHEDENFVFHAIVPGASDEMIGAITFSWTFGDINSNTTNPDKITGLGVISASHIYTDAGQYVINLAAADGSGNEETASLEIDVLNVVPTPDIQIMRRSTFMDEHVTFIASPSSDTASDIGSLTYSWALPGEAATPFEGTPSIERTYTVPGTYTIILQAKDKHSAVGTVTKTFRVDNQPPLAIAGKFLDAVEGEPVGFDGTSSLDTSSDMAVLRYDWSFGDGTNATGAKVDHTYSHSGRFIVRLTVSDPHGAMSLDEQLVRVLNKAPVAVARYTQTGGSSFITVDASESTDSPGDMPFLVYEWTPQSAASTTGKTATIRFNELGIQKVTLKVTDPEGESSYTEILVTVTNLAPSATLSIKGDLLEDSPVRFVATGILDHDDEVIECRWDMDSSDVPESARQWGPVVNSTAELGLTIREAGDLTVVLYLRDGRGGTSFESLQFKVWDPPPTAVFASEQISVVGRTIDFDASATKDNPSDMGLLVYNWSFGDGNTSQGQLVRHAYSQPGEYLVTLSVSDNVDVRSVVTRVVTIIRQELLDRIGANAFDIDVSVNDQLDGELGIVPDEVVRVIGVVALVEGWDGPNIIGRYGVDITVNVPLTNTVWRGKTNPDGSFSVPILTPSKAGKFFVTVTATIAPLSSNETIERTVDGPAAPAPSYAVPIAIGVTTGMATIIAVGAVGGTDLGRYKFFTMLIPLFTRLRRPKVLDHFERGRIYEHIRKTPGDSYSSIRKALGIQNGALAHHLRVLEAHEYIISRRDGMYKRFYPKGMRIPEGGHKSIQEQMLEMIMANPKITQKQMAERLGIDRSTVNYHIKILLAMGVIRSEKDGKTKYYYFVGIKDPLPFEG